MTGRVSLPPDAKFLDIKVTDMPVDRVTNYWCIWFEVPADAKYHMYEAEVRGSSARPHA
jgi:hypothetical protein